ncbi:MAG: hypothetical protein IT306_12790 [Chloroflexi bacterium]|nr:hypothetical protein [Chloroflexota bacterium]
MVCLACGGRNHDEAQRCWRCSVAFDESPAGRSMHAHHAERSEIERSETELRLPRLRWFQSPAVWLPLIRQAVRRLEAQGWRIEHEIEIPGLVATGALRRGHHRVSRAADADRVVLSVIR